MNILIKGIKMPKSCWDCELGSAQQLDDTPCPFYSMDYREQEKYSDKRADGCPLIELPPHGRLIDADAMAEDLDFDVENDQRALDQMDFVGKEREHIQFDKDCKQNCIRYLSEAPTIIPANKESKS